MTETERAWLLHFNQAEAGYVNHLTYLTSDRELITKLKKIIQDKHNSYRRDIYNNYNKMESTDESL